MPTRATPVKCLGADELCPPKQKGVSYAHPYSYSSLLIIPQFARAVKYSLRANHLRQTLDTAFHAIQFHYTTGRHFCQANELRRPVASAVARARHLTPAANCVILRGGGVSVRALYANTHNPTCPRTNTQKITQFYTNEHNGREPFAPSPSRPTPPRSILLGVSKRLC